MKKWSISICVLAALAVAAFVAPGASAAGTCPPGQVGTPPYCTTPPPPPPKTCTAGQVGTPPNCVTPALTISKIKVNPRTATITALVNAPGSVKVSGNGIKTKTKQTQGGKVTLPVLLTPQKAKELKNGKVRVKATITYSPTGASAITKQVSIVFKGAKKPSKQH